MLEFLRKQIKEDEKTKPVLKWAGGKGSLLPQISMKFPNKLRCGAISKAFQMLSNSELEYKYEFAV